MRVSLLTGGDDPNYAVPLAASLARRGLTIEFVGNDDMQGAPDLRHPNIEYLNLRGNQDPRAPFYTKVVRLLRYYYRLIRHTRRTPSTLFHILWLNKFKVLDRTVLNLIYRMMGKRLVLTVHNVNTAKRDGHDGWVNRATLRTMYALMDHLFVHTPDAKRELVEEFRVSPEKVTVIPFGLNTYVPDTSLSRRDARDYFGLNAHERVLLFFGQIAPYKGPDVLLEALRQLTDRPERYRLVIAGRAKADALAYWKGLASRLRDDVAGARVLLRDNFIPDAEISILFKAADVLVLPYRAIYQSGPLSLAYRFGVPVIATRLAAFEAEVIQGVTGFLANPEDPRDLARAIGQYFESDLYRRLDDTSERIRQIGLERYSWDDISQTITGIYERIHRPASHELRERALETGAHGARKREA